MGVVFTAGNLVGTFSDTVINTLHFLLRKMHIVVESLSEKLKCFNMKMLLLYYINLILMSSHNLD